MVEGLVVTMHEGTVKYPELLAKAVEGAVDGLKYNVARKGGMLAEVVDGKLQPGETIAIRIMVESHFISQEDIDNAEA